MLRTRSTLAATLFLMAAAPLGAQSIDFGTLCGTVAGDIACVNASAELFVGYMEVRVQNAEGPTGVGDPSRITGFGVYHLGASMGPAGTLGGTIPGGNWNNGLGGGGGALGSPGPVGTEFWLAAASVGGNGGTWGCTDPTGNNKDVSSCAGPLIFRFNGVDQSQVRLDELHFAFRAQSVGDSGESLKCYSSDPTTSAHSCIPVITTPEPTTLALLGLGLFGIGGVGAVRRRGQAA